MSIGLARAAIWLPEEYQDAADISARSGVPEEVVRQKMGIVRKCRAPSSMHTSMLAIEAAKRALEGIDPDSIDLLIWTGSEYKDYPVWTAGIYVQEQLGLRKAWAFDMASRCSSNVVGLKVAKAMMTADPNLNRVLLCGGHRTGDLVNFKDPNARFLYSLSDGGSALLLERGAPNEILHGAVITDGSFSEDVIIPGGGTRKPARDGLAYEDTFLCVPDVKGMRERLADRSLENFVQVIRDAAQGSMEQPIDYLALLHLKRSAHDHILGTLGLEQEQSIYMDHFGHFGAPDQVVSLGLAERASKLKAGDHVVLASAGIGYTWSAISLRWQEPCFSGMDMLARHQPK